MVGNTLLVTAQVESREAVVTDGELFRSCCLLVLSSPLYHPPLLPSRAGCILSQARRNNKVNILG